MMAGIFSIGQQTHLEVLLLLKLNRIEPWAIQHIGCSLFLFGIENTKK